MIEVTLQIPLEEFIANKDLWPTDKDAPITSYCGRGHRFTIAAAMMWTYGYPDVTSLSGGLGGWVNAGYPDAEYTAMQ